MSNWVKLLVFMSDKNREKGVYMNLRQNLVRFIKDEQGQSTTEYILILSVVVMIAMKFKGIIIPKLESMVDRLGGNMQSVIDQQ